MSLTDKEKEIAEDVLTDLFHRSGNNLYMEADVLLVQNGVDMLDRFLSRIREEQSVAPCDYEELVEALENANDVLDHLITSHKVVAGHRTVVSCFEKIRRAIANHAKRQQKPSEIKVGDTCGGQWPTMKGEE